MISQRLPRIEYSTQLWRAVEWVKTRHWSPSKTLVLRVLKSSERFEYDVMDRLSALEAENAALRQELDQYQKEKESRVIDARDRLQILAERLGPEVFKEAVKSLA